MDYGNITISAYPHITNLEESFIIDFNQYLYSMIAEIIFTLIIIPFLVFAIYFSAKKVKKNGINIDTTRELQKSKRKKLNNQDQTSSIDQRIYTLKTIKIKKQRQTSSQIQNIQMIRIDRKLNYFVVFLMLNAIAINSFDASIIIIIMMGLQILLFIIFNLGACKLFSKYKFFRGIYIIPLIGSFIPYAIGNHKLTSS